jgi:hypothetical protein
MLREVERDLEDLEEEDAVEREENKAKQMENSASNTPATPMQQFRRPKASVGDAFPDADEVKTAKQMRGQMRRLHTVGLGR